MGGFENVWEFQNAIYKARSRPEWLPLVVKPMAGRMLRRIGVRRWPGTAGLDRAIEF
ncbi:MULTISPECIES: hypothetical protein [Bradyrhizobium]|jgi:hypothetical protein|uniref:hypothetical protein n=1 Tax=Bradyrhizobium TaxID=374 RepID=UPI000B0C71C1|nr:hypothetical protein [Bradyrhizobium japonicum]MBR0761582.1 hypothetical protein [Bradyrhizobium japonicum]MCD9108006.1 hypothetical protein [Bradyrhizobium japonicum]MCD9252411.1 hypothetical protein [Bradyrhizobium japonicum SEMIA 5079]MCD9816887.1 hypothetical protein [Bradyrhizobium japonicum]MCD9891904.1 hypothetical protein [Bradyrhizobium japonicum]